jgi:hypothetical protein
MHVAHLRFSLAILLLVALPGRAVADVRGVLHVRFAPVDLAPDEDTPVFGARVGDAVGAYNAAAEAYNVAHGYPDGSPMATAAIGPDDLGVRTTLVTFAPGFEAGHRNVYFRLEAAIGFADDLRAYGVGVYPLNLAAHLRRGTVVPYLSAGGTASWLDRPSTDGELGALVTARLAGGIRFGRRATLEVGYGAFVLGGLIDRGRIRTMEDYDPSGAAPPPAPTDAIAGGEQRGLIDVSFGLLF